MPSGSCYEWSGFAGRVSGQPAAGPDNSGRNQALQLSFGFFHFGAWRIALYRCHAILAATGSFVHLALADYLAIAGF